MNGHGQLISGGAESGDSIPPVPPQTPVAETLFTPEQIADMQSEMNRLMRDYPDGNIPEDKIQEWEVKAQAARLGQEIDVLQEAIAADESLPKARKKRAAKPVHDTPPADMVPPTQDSAETDVIRLNRADLKLALQLARLYAVTGLVVTTLNQVDGVLIMSTAEDRAKELVLLANHHPNLKKALRSMTESNDYIIFAMGHGGLLVALLQNHGVMPQNIGQSIARLFQRKPKDEAYVTP